MTSILVKNTRTILIAAAFLAIPLYCQAEIIVTVDDSRATTEHAGAKTFYNWDGTNDTAIATTSLVDGVLNGGNNPGGSGNWYSLADGTQSVDIHFTGKTGYFGLRWGSPDKSNFVDFFADEKLIKTIAGTSVSGDGGFVNCLAQTPEDEFDRVTLRTNAFTFEFDNLAAVQPSSSASVPVPDAK